jgi:hypothetical protein
MWDGATSTEQAMKTGPRAGGRRRIITTERDDYIGLRGAYSGSRVSNGRKRGHLWRPMVTFDRVSGGNGQLRAG